VTLARNRQDVHGAGSLPYALRLSHMRGLAFADWINLAVVSVKLSCLGLAGQRAQVLFRLIGGTDPSSSSTVTLSNVDVIVASVPEPSAFVLASLAFLFCAGFGWRRQSSKRRPALPWS